jgi:hypothetical protein
MLEFTMPQGAAHTIFIQGPVPCGKSYSWYFVRHLAQIAGANALPLKLKGTDYKPRQFFEQIFRLLDLDPTKLPPMADDPQLARIDAPMNAFRGAVSKLQQPTWLVIDDLNEQDVKPSIREAAYEVAAAVEEMRPPNLWVILIGYPDSIAADDRVALSGREEPQFPDVELVAHHLEELSKLSQRPITSARAEELSQILFSRIANPDKVSMSDLTRRLRPLGDMLRSGTEVKIE